MVYQNKEVDALGYLFTAHLMNDKNLSTIYNLALVLSKLGVDELAIIYFEKFISIIATESSEKMHEHLVNIYHLYAISLVRLNKLEDALCKLNLAIGQKKDPLFYFERGKIYFYLKKYEKALEDFNLVINEEIKIVDLGSYFFLTKTALEKESEKTKELLKQKLI